MTSIKQFPPPIDSIEYANFINKGKDDEKARRKNIQKKVELMLYNQYVNTLDGSEYKDEVSSLDRMIWNTECSNDRIEAKIETAKRNKKTTPSFPSLSPLSLVVGAVIATSIMTLERSSMNLKRSSMCSI